MQPEAAAVAISPRSRRTEPTIEVKMAIRLRDHWSVSKVSADFLPELGDVVFADRFTTAPSFIPSQDRHLDIILKEKIKGIITYNNRAPSPHTLIHALR